MNKAVRTRGWDIDSVNSEQKNDRERNRIIRARQRAIGRELRRHFDSVVGEPIPEEFLNLLQKIDERSEGSDGMPENDKG